MSAPDSTWSKQDPDALARRLRHLHPRRVKKLLDELGLDDPAEGLEHDYSRYGVLTLAPLAYEDESYRMTGGGGNA